MGSSILVIAPRANLPVNSSFTCGLEPHGFSFEPIDALESHAGWWPIESSDEEIGVEWYVGPCRPDSVPGVLLPDDRDKVVVEIVLFGEPHGIAAGLLLAALVAEVTDGSLIDGESGHPTEIATIRGEALALLDAP